MVFKGPGEFFVDVRDEFGPTLGSTFAFFAKKSPFYWVKWLRPLIDKAFKAKN
jgi:hypothetical protein